MDKSFEIVLILTLFFVLLIAASCQSLITEENSAEKVVYRLQATTDAQNTTIAELAASASEQVVIDRRQWDAISYLSTSMPEALGLVTPISHKDGITSTPYKEGSANFLTNTPSPTNGLEYSPDTRTGIPEIDLVIDAIMSGDIDERIKLVRYSISGCTTADGLGGPPKCGQNEPENTLVEAFPVSYSEGIQVRPEDIRSVFDFSIRRLLAVYRVPSDAYNQVYWPAGTYSVVFMLTDERAPMILEVFVDSGEIVRLGFNLVSSLQQMLEGKDLEFILPPLYGK